MINNGENGYLTVKACEKSFGVEAAGDYTLPDYQSDIRRILHVSQTVLPPAKYIGGDSVEFNGTVDYQVLYVGGDGGMYSAPLSGEYSFSVPLERGGDIDVTDGVTVLCHMCAEGVNTRVSAPRRLSIRSRLRPNVRVYGKMPVGVRMLSEVDPVSVYTKTGVCKSLVCDSAVSDVISLSYTAPLSSEDMRVVCADARVCVTGTECSGSGVSCRGKVLLKLLCAAPDENGDGEVISTVSADVPFEGDVDMDDCSSDRYCRVHGVLSEMSVNVSESGVQCDIGIILEAMAARNAEVEYTEDVYSTERECACEMRQTASVALLSCGNANVTLSERIPLEKTGVPENAQIVDALGSVCFDGCTLTDGRYAYSGTASLVLIYRNDGELYSTDINIPVRYEAQTSAEGAPTCFDGCAELTDIRARVEKGELSVDAELLISADCMGETAVCAVESASFGETFAPRECELTVCYPASDDTLWSVAKRYRVAPADIMGDPENDRYVMIE